MKTNILGQGEFEAKMLSFKQPMKKKKIILLSNALRVAKEADSHINDLEFHNSFQDQLKHYTQIALDNQFELIECRIIPNSEDFLVDFKMNYEIATFYFDSPLGKEWCDSTDTCKFIEWADNLGNEK